MDRDSQPQIDASQRPGEGPLCHGTGRRFLHLAMTLLPLFGLSGLAEARASEDLSAAHGELLEIIQGPPMMVSASPALCAAQGRPVMPGADADAQRWLFGSACTLFFAPDLGAAISRATTALEREAARPATAGRIAPALDRVLAALDSPAPALDRLLAQSLAWEIGIAALRGADDPGLACKALEVVDRSRLTADALSELPDTLDAAAAASAEATSQRLAQLRSNDPLLLEVLPPSTSHAEALRGRFTARLFVTSLQESEAQKMRQELTEGATNYDFLGQLPFRYDDVYALLLLYYNALVEEEPGRLAPTTTPVLAFWQEYSFGGRADREPTLRQAEAKLTFRSIAVDAKPGQPLAYREIPGTAMAHKSFVDAMPPTTGSPVTTKHGVCLRCHTRVIEAFHPQSRRDVRFAPALSESAQVSLDHAFEGLLLQELERWQQICRDD